ncbi:fructan 6-exohydrolase-like [Triticum aestivum]|uniref:fructan 6-exohydrolase-like n=1 Tax=Triticum aestivum TaxID=4565 RepID=UPI001D02D270|nr:fructan 6-exohydrolase-like [Triticum aestivum]
MAMAGLPLAACVAFFHLCLLLSPSSSLRLLPVAPDAAGESTGRNGSRTAYHFQPAKNWMNDPNGRDLSADLPRRPLVDKKEGPSAVAPRRRRSPSPSPSSVDPDRFVAWPATGRWPVEEGNN